MTGLNLNLRPWSASLDVNDDHTYQLKLLFCPLFEHRKYK